MDNVASISQARTKRSKPPSPTNGAEAFKRGDHVEIAKRLVQDLRAVDATIYSDGQVWRYNEQTHVYVPIDVLMLRKQVQEYAGILVLSGSTPKPLKVSSGLVSGVLTLAYDQLHHHDYFADAPVGLAFANGFVTVSGGETQVVAHSASHKARFRYPFEFDSTATPKNFLNFLSQVFCADNDGEDKIKLLQEYVGTALLGQCTRYQRVIVMVGSGSNGKGVLCSVIEAVMPTGSVVSIAPQDFGDYSRHLLAGKLLNVVAELKEVELLDTSSFKAIVAGDRIKARQIRENPFTFRPVAGHIYSANRLPATGDQSHGFWRRMLIMTFNRVFAPNMQNPNLADELKREELPAIVSWFLAGAMRVQLRGCYTIPSSHQAALDKWRHDADPVRAFAQERLSRFDDAELMLPSRIVYAEYRRWCQENGHRALAINRFGERMKLIDMGPKHTMHGSFYPVALR